MPTTTVPDARRSALIPCLRYDDAPAALGWLERAFGLRPGLVVPGEAAGTVAHAQLALGEGGMVMLGSRRRAGAAEEGGLDRLLDATRQTVYGVVPDADAHHARAAAAGARVVLAPRDTPHGSREYAALDPEGHLWCFGTYDPWAEGAGAAAA